MTLENIDLRTPLQRQRDERNKEIFRIYKEIKRKLPNDTPELSIYRIIGEQFKLQAQGVRSVINKMKLQKQ
ncbi:hypothetical protein AB4865_10905 [Capnocytophaga sp. ARDL2]|uniref:hypothetical protein n=1 Tax=Capnocytophaga sp. ARDL2 TaxID=3238809 RepID=UPI0035575C75